LDVDTCLRKGVNVVIGTDSTLSGSINLLSEMSFAHQKAPHIPAKTIYQMVSQNAIKALFLNEKESALQEKDNDSILIMRAKTSDPYENLLECNNDDILLHLWKGKPVYGDAIFLEHFAVDQEDYFIYKKNGVERFALGHPEKIIETIDNILGYPKTLPYLPFQND
jgi:cytosine/adenosine deaminase-related metal-dependent hydrolase